MTDKRRLGRGLDALLGGMAEPTSTAVAEPTGTQALPLDRIHVNPNQPRKDFDEDDLTSLKESLRTHGLLQPILVRPKEDGYEIIAGERRFRAAKDAGWAEIPVHVVDFNDQKVFEAALIENLQRTDLNPIEKALGFQDYLQRYQVTQDELAKVVGLDRSTVANLIRLLELAPSVQDAVRHGQISAGHARALLPVEEPARQVTLMQEIIAKGLSVRQVEALIKVEEPSSTTTSKPTSTAPVKTSHVQQIEDELKQRLTTKVAIRLKSHDKGQIVIGFENNDDFERILTALRGESQRHAA
ncbi:MAG TPA: ParB/RepB/Spo0J family partition protein [Gemmatales bacterium]|nr:ParB/RepB/Spo0J family partition protein [Gemmatales bacterium]